MIASKPWEGLVTTQDISSFAAGAAAATRPIAAGTKPALVIVDMTLAFVDSAYPTGHSATGWPAVASNAILLKAARRLGIPVYFTKAHPDPLHANLPAERGRWKLQGASTQPEGLPPGDVVVDELEPLPSEIVIYKGMKPSGFFGTPLASYLAMQGVDTVVVTGMTTSGCVRATVLDAFMNSFHVIVPHECSADRSQISHQVNLFDMHMKYADVCSLEEAIAYLEGVIAAPQPA